MRKLLFISVASMLLTGCDLAPDFMRPAVTTPSSFKERTTDGSVEPASDGKWKRFDEQAQIEEFAWWRMFNDDTLNGLMDQAMLSNPSLEVALNRVKSARAAAGITQADEYPSVEVGAGPERTKQSAGAQQPNLPPGVHPNVKPYTLYGVRGTIAYELDLFGRNRNLAKEAEHKAESEQNNYRAARLSLQADLAQTYYEVSSLRAQEALLATVVTTRQHFLKLTNEKVNAGAADTVVLAAAQSALAAATSEFQTVRDARAKAEHALAILIGIPPTELQIDAGSLDAPPPTVPVGLPSDLLERRPDIHAAEEMIAAANADIGVARSGYFPDISLSLSGGYTSSELSELFNWSNHTWMVGPLAGTMLSQPIFEGGRVAAARAQADAGYGAAVAQYKSAVLQAFREVEDQLSALQAADERFKAADEALAASHRAHDAAKERFDAGYSSQLDYLDAQRTHLEAQRSNIDARAEQYMTTIQLIRALGGSWESVAGTPQSQPEVTSPDASTAPQQGAQQDAVDQDKGPTPTAVHTSSDSTDAATPTDESANPNMKDATVKPMQNAAPAPSDPHQGLEGLRVVPENSAF